MTLRKKKNIGKAYYDKQYSNAELDSILSQIVNYNEEQVLKVNWANFQNTSMTIDDYYYRCRYIRSFGYITIEEFREDISNKLYQFEVSVTDLGVRFLADGGFEGKERREVTEKEVTIRHQNWTRRIAAAALITSAMTFYNGCERNRIAAPTKTIKHEATKKAIKTVQNLVLFTPPVQ